MTKNSFYVSDILKRQESGDLKKVVRQFQDQRSADLRPQDLNLESKDKRHEGDPATGFDDEDEEIVVDGDYKHQVSGLCLQWKYIKQWVY